MYFLLAMTTYLVCFNFFLFLSCLLLTIYAKYVSRKTTTKYPQSLNIPRQVI